jgi:hypothetical protein
MLSSCVLAFVGIVGIIVAVWQLGHVAAQVREARLSSSMNGSIMLYDRFQQLQSVREAIDRIWPADFGQRSEDKQIEFIRETKVNVNGEERPLTHACIDIANLYEEIGLLVVAEALPESIAFAFFGGSTILWWERLRAWILAGRARTKKPLIFDGFEKLAGRFSARQTGTV